MADCPHYIAREDGERLYCQVRYELTHDTHAALAYGGFIEGEPPADQAAPVAIRWVSGAVAAPDWPDIPWQLEDYIDEDKAREAQNG